MIAVTLSLLIGYIGAKKTKAFTHSNSSSKKINAVIKLNNLNAL